ncbi:MAG TPA: DMT family transporter, partial [Rhodocyclaceae bacterium]
ALLAGPLLGERIDAWRWAAVVAGFCGVLLVGRPGGAMTPSGIAWALAAAACNAIYQVQTRMLAPSENNWAMLFYTALVGAAVMTLGLPLFWSGTLPTFTQALMIASLGVYGGIGHFLLIRAFRHTGASTLAPFNYVQLVWATLFGIAFYDHVPDHVSIAGMTVIAASSIAMAAMERRRR